MPKKEVFSLELNVGANITQARNAATQLRDAFAKINLTDSLKGSLEKTFTNLEKELANFEGMANKPFTNMKDVQKAEKSYERIVDLFNELSIQGKNISGMDPNKFLPKEIINRINTLQTSLKSVRTTINNTNKTIESQNREYNQASQQQINYQNKIKETEGAIKSYQGSLGATTKALNDTQKKQSELTQKQQEYLDNGGKKSDPQYQQLGRELSALQKQYAGLSSTQNSYRKQIGELKADLNGYVASEKAAGESAQEHKEQVDKLKQSLQNPQGLTELREEISKLSGIPLDQITTDTDELEKEITKLSQAQLKQISEDLKLVGDKSKDISNTANSVGDLDKKVDELGNDAGKLTETAAEIERLGNQVKQFFSIGNTIQLFKRAVRDAMNTVKELDATMTETATVTNYSISDMWEQLPKYTEEANKLGTSINSLYKATTLYYQQGLETNEAMALGIETIKMARVANMDAALATDLMTAALRGFNMELNEMSAVRINDVYSELAAVTAADTDEIGIAISKTASIAHSANMEFETTAAFLSQIIETTREAPETAGTAMKTIIARFSEVKKLYSEGQILGTDEEGEAINVNKIQEALRTVGIDMTKFFVGAEGLDDVLLRLAEKWDTLDVATQRYIATQAAGSRQQSRFLAMMSDYDRTLQLVDAAYDSAGSGQAQFEKTLDSMQAKLAELKNAWDQFVMGIANSDFLKAGIDALTNVVSVINKILNAISGGNGLIKSIASLGASFLALRGGAKLFGSGDKGGFIGKFIAFLKGKDVTKQAGEAGQQVAKSFGEKFNSFISGGLDVKGIGKFFTKGIKSFFSKPKEFFTNELSGNSIENLFQEIYGDKELKFDFDAQQELLNTEGYRKQIEDLGYTVTEVDGKFKVFGKGLENTGVNARAVGVAATALGGILIGLGDDLEKKGKGIGTFIKTIGTTITVVGSAVTLLGGSFTKAGVQIGKAGAIAQLGWWPFIGILTAIMAMVALVTVAINNTPEKKLERAQQKAEASTQAAQEAQQAYDDLLSDKNNYNELEEKVKSLTKDTQEWKDAVAELNDEVVQLSQKYEGLEFEYNEDGILEIKNWAEVEKQSKKERDETLFKSLKDNLEVTETKKDNLVTGIVKDSNGEIISRKLGESDEDFQRRRIVESGKSVELNQIEKQAQIDRKNMILAFMPDSVDKAEANQVGQAMVSLIGEGIDEATTPEEIQDKIKDFYNLFSTQGINAKDLFSGKAIFKDSLDYKDFGISDEFYEKYQKQVDNLIQANQDRITKVKDGLARIGTDLSIVGEDDAEALVEKTSKMGLDEAKAYYESWNKIKQKSSKLGSNLLGLEAGNINDLTSIIEQMRKAGVAEEDVQNYWKTLLAGADNFEIKLTDITNRADALSESFKEIDELGKRMEEGTLTGEDIQKLQDAGVDISTLQRTAEGWRLVGDEAEAALAKMRGDLVNAEQTTTKTLENLLSLNDEELAKQLGMNIYDYSDVGAYLQALGEARTKLEQNLELQRKNEEYAEASNFSATQNKIQGGSEQSVIYSAQNEAQEAGLDTTDLTTYAEELQKINTNLKDNAAVANIVALGNMKLNAGLGEIISSYNDWTQLIDDSTGLIKTETSDDMKVFDNLRRSINKMLNTSEDLSDAFWNNAENINNAKKAAEGDIEALEQLQKAAAQDYLSVIKTELDPSSYDLIDEFGNYLMNYDLPQLEAGVELNGYDDFINRCNELIEASGMTSQQVAEYFRRMGFDANIQEVEKTVTEPLYAKRTVIDSYDAITGIPTHMHEESYVSGYTTKTIKVPVVQTLTSTGSGGGGISTSNLKAGGGNKGGKGGGGGGSKKQDNWKNPYDKYYNLTEKINEALRTREKIERDYDRILKRRERTAAELLNNSAQEIANLRQEVQYQKRLQAGRREQIQNVAGERYDNGDQITTFEKMGVTKYANYNFDTQTIEIDWAAIEAVRDEELGKAIEAYVGRLEELQGQFEDTQTTIEDMEDTIWEINQRGKEEYLSFEQRVLDALIAADQKIIDDLSAKFEGINSANDKILNSMQEQIDLERQIRDNTKTEDDIAQKEARLAYLRRDTSGANATEIMKLEQELADARQNYTDTLIDQGLQKLSDENQRAAEQRQEQIDIMQSIHDWTVESGGFNQKAEELINEAAAAGEVTEAIKTLLQDNEGWTSMTKFAGEKWMTDLANEYKAAMEGMSNFKVDEAKTKNTSSKNALAVTDANGKNQQSVWFDSSKNRWIDSKGNLYDIYYDPTANNGQGGYKYSNKSAAEDENAWLKEYLDSIAGSLGNLGSSSGGSGSGGGSSGGSSTGSGAVKKTYYEYSQEVGGKKYSGKGFTSESKAINDFRTKLASRITAINKSGSSDPSLINEYAALTSWYNKKNDDYKKIIKTYKAYKTGGLNTQTGPAWLDGTKAHPELVLNARDTENFIQLKDILSGMGSLDKLQNGGDNYYNFDIKVDQLASDYDVDKLIGKIKNEIDKDARYRNVNSINFIR